MSLLWLTNVDCDSLFNTNIFCMVSGLVKGGAIHTVTTDFLII